MQELFGRSSRNPGEWSGAATETRLLAQAAAIFAGIAQIESKSLQDFSGKFLEMQDDIHSSRKLGAALIAGLIAIVVNTAMLEAADLIPLVTARGGLLKRLKIYFASPLAGLGVADLWAALHLPAADTNAFKTGFHILVGLLMAVFYAFVLEPVLSGLARVKGLVYALLLWLANAFIVLPWVGEGIAGSRYLSAAGMIYFAAAHTVFFVLLALLYAGFTR
jgi:hypothetical protein